MKTLFWKIYGWINRILNQERFKYPVEKCEFLIRFTGEYITIGNIQFIVCKYLKVQQEDLQKNTRKREVVRARQISMYFSKKLTPLSLASIGKSIGDKDHATVLHAVKTVSNDIDTDKYFANQVSEIEERLLKFNSN